MSPVMDSGQQPRAADPAMDSREPRTDFEALAERLQIETEKVNAFLVRARDLKEPSEEYEAWKRDAPAEALRLARLMPQVTEALFEAEAAEQALRDAGGREAALRERVNALRFKYLGLMKEAEALDEALAADPASPSPAAHAGLRFDHDGLWPHHHDADTGDPVFWVNPHHEGPQTNHRHASSSPAAQEPPLNVERLAVAVALVYQHTMEDFTRGIAGPQTRADARAIAAEYARLASSGTGARAADIPPSEGSTDAASDE